MTGIASGISARDQIGITDRLRRNQQPSLAGAKATRRLKRRQGLCRVRQVSLESSNLVEAELVPNSEDSTWVIATRDDLAPPGSRAASRTKGCLRDPGDPTGTIGRSTMGAPSKGRPELGAEPRSGVGPVHSTTEALEGNEGAERRDRPGGNRSEKAKVRTQRRVALPLNLWRWYGAAKRDKQARFTALLHHVNITALERAFRRLKRSASTGVDGETAATYEQNREANPPRALPAGAQRDLPALTGAAGPKSDGGQRPLGVPALEHKIVQGAVAEVLSAIYEVDFLGISYEAHPPLAQGRCPGERRVARDGGRDAAGSGH